MKKMMAFLLAVLLIAPSAIAAFADSVDFVGVWYGAISEVIPVEMAFHADGTSTTDLMGDMLEGTWEFDGVNIITDKGTAGEDTLYYNPEQGTLSSSYGGMELVLSREARENYSLPAARTDATLEEFSGEWDCKLVDTGDGMAIPPMLAEIDLDLSIDGTKAKYTVSILGMPSELEVETTFAEGCLVVHDVSVEDQIIQLHEDGRLSVPFMLELDTYSLPLTFIMERLELSESAS